VRKDKISAEEFETRVKTVLAAKYWAGLNHPQEINIEHLVEDLNRTDAKNLIQQLSDAAVTLVKGDASTLQLNPLGKTAIVSIGISQATIFQQGLAEWYANSSLFQVDKNTPAAELSALTATLKQYDQVFVSINDTRPRPASKLDFSNDVKQFVTDLAAHKNTVVSVFANAYTIAGLAGIEKCGALLVCYQMTDYLQRSAVKIITQQLKPIGHLPVTINKAFVTGTGISL
jgi:beta-glucosidase-like glycosyl hydrolase